MEDDKKKKHVHKPDPTMEELCDNCGHGYTWCVNCEKQYLTQDGGKTWDEF